MIWIVVAFLLIIAAVIILIKLPQKQQVITLDYPYQPLEALFTRGEQAFLIALEQAIGERAKIFGKIRVADIITPKKGLSRSDWQKAFNKISSKHLDFVVCDRHNLSIICAIELDDKSHQQKKRQDRDKFLNQAFESAGLPLVRVAAQSSYGANTIQHLLSPYIDFKSLVSPASKAPPKVAAANENSVQSVAHRW